MADLKPCPFCGSKDLVPSFHKGAHETLVCVACESCEAEGPAKIVGGAGQADALQHARTAWDKRS